MPETATEKPPFGGSRRNEALLVYGGVTLFLIVLQYQPLGFLKRHVGTAAAVLFLYAPIYLGDHRREPLSRLGLTWDHWRADLKAFALFAGLTFPPYIVCFHFWTTSLWGGTPGFALPPDLLQLTATHLFLVALPEEVFYRGYMQRELDREGGREIFGVRMGWGSVQVAALFAIGHFVLIPDPSRLSVFIPSLAFSWLRGRTGTVLAAAGYHAACNVLARVLFVSYGLG